ncbi:hypothetical protein ACFZBU_39310 [Embleya sp. NPDC008237]|uniref:hypothetical protein n=1 Tax=Embleya sp. NPDC008237 TaxID=3363978 RepID=UPI0036EEA0C9
MGAGSRATSPTCRECRRHFTLPPARRGRPPEYCGPKCRASAANTRKREGRARGRDTPDDTTPADVLLTLATSLVKAYRRGAGARQLNHLHEQLHAENLRLAAARVGAKPRPSSRDPRPAASITPSPPARIPPDHDLPAQPFDRTAPANERPPDHLFTAAPHTPFTGNPDIVGAPPNPPPAPPRTPPAAHPGPPDPP